MKIGIQGMVLRSTWEERYGRRYYYFRYKDVLFLVFDTEDTNSERMDEINVLRDEAFGIIEKMGIEAFAETEYANLPEDRGGTVGAEQSEYFQRVISANEDVRWTFLFMHKAPWERENTSTFTDIEYALSGRPYTVFHGHRHAYEHLVRNGRDYIQLATTGGAQFADRGLSTDHVMLLTLSGNELDIVNLRLDGILDKTGHIPHGGDDICFEATVCGAQN